MTKEQAREYATRIRLGEPLWFWRTPDPRIPAAWLGACFSDRTPIVAWSNHLDDDYRLSQDPIPGLAALEPLIPDNRNAVLSLLDQRANEP
jgi:hypothetical protein